MRLQSAIAVLVSSSVFGSSYLGSNDDCDGVSYPVDPMYYTISTSNWKVHITDGYLRGTYYR